MNKANPKTAIGSTSKERLRLWLRFLKASRQIETQLRELMRTEFSSTLPRFDVLAALSRYEAGLKMSQISAVLRVSNGNVTGIVDRLADDGMLVRVPVQGDRRALLVRLTKRGHEEFKMQAEKHEAWVNEMLSGFSSEDANHIGERLDQLSNCLETKST